MPDFDKLHDHARRLAVLTDPKGREPGLCSWGEAVVREWKTIVEMWGTPATEGAEVSFLVQCMMRDNRWYSLSKHSTKEMAKENIPQIENGRDAHPSRAGARQEKTG